MRPATRVVEVADLVDERGPAQAGDEPLGVGDRPLACLAAIEAQLHQLTPLAAGYLARERALAGLSGSGDEYDPRIGERVQHQWLGVTGE